MSKTLRYYIQQENGRAEHVDKKTTSERPAKQVRAAINQISEHPDKKKTQILELQDKKRATNN